MNKIMYYTKNEHNQRGENMEKIKIPKYTLGEEITNSITHGIGGLLGIAALVLAIVRAAINHHPAGVVASSIYGATMIIMFTISCLYHSFSPKIKAKKVFRIIDHCDIYVFIAGCYTPFCISLIGGALGWTLFGVIWGCAIIGVILNAINLEKYKVISFILYLIMGWMVVASIGPLKNLLPVNGLILLVSGGVAYTLGALFYLVGAKKKYIHSVFHVFVLIGAVLQFFSIYLYAI